MRLPRMPEAGWDEYFAVCSRGEVAVITFWITIFVEDIVLLKVIEKS